MRIRELPRVVARWCRQHESRFIYYCSPAEMRRTAPPMHPDVRPVVCDSGNLARVLSEVDDLPAWLPHRVRRGEIAILGVHERQWVFLSMAIIGPRIFTFLGYPFPLGYQDAMLEAAETHPVWRGQGVAPGMLHPTADILTTLGVAHVYLSIEVHNSASCRAAEKGGIRCIGQLEAHLRWGRWRRAILHRFATADRPVVHEAQPA